LHHNVIEGRRKREINLKDKDKDKDEDKIWKEK
jgi:hypothetical protein